MTTTRDPELTTAEPKFCRRIDSFVDAVFDYLVLMEHAPLSVQKKNSFGSNRGLVKATHSAAIARNHARIGGSSRDIFTEAPKSTA